MEIRHAGKSRMYTGIWLMIFILWIFVQERRARQYLHRKEYVLFYSVFSNMTATKLVSHIDEMVGIKAVSSACLDNALML